MEKKYLNEETYQRNAKGLKIVGAIVLIIGIIAFVVSVIIMFKGFLGSGAITSVNDADYEAKSKLAHDSFALFSIGGFGMVVSLAICGAGWKLLIIAHRREIMAFTAQQAMPVVKEGAEELAPVAGNVAMEVAKGIKQGINEADSEK